MEDGIANIDEMLNGVGRSLHRFPVYCTLSAIMQGRNTMQRAGLWKKPVLGIPVDFTDGDSRTEPQKATPLPALLPSEVPGTKSLSAVPVSSTAGQEAKR